MNSNEKNELTAELAHAMKVLSSSLNKAYIANTGLYLVYAAEKARSAEEVAEAFRAPSDQIEKDVTMRDESGDKLESEIIFGGNSGISNCVLTAMRFDSDIRSAAVIRYLPEMISKANELLMNVRQIDRSKESAVGSNVDWGIAFTCSIGEVPDIIFDLGHGGNDPLIRVFGDTPMSVVNNILMLSERINNKNYSQN